MRLHFLNMFFWFVLGIVLAQLIYFVKVRRQTKDMAEHILKTSDDPICQNAEFRHFYISNIGMFLDFIGKFLHGISRKELYLVNVVFLMGIFFVDIIHSKFIISACAVVLFALLYKYHFGFSMANHNDVKKLSIAAYNYRYRFPSDAIWRETDIDEFGEMESVFYTEKFVGYYEKSLKVTGEYLQKI
jgi:hypothetical protein